MPATITANQVETVVFDALVTLGSDREAVSRDATLERLDVDSLDLAELGQIVTEELGVELQLKSNDVTDIKTVGDAIDLLLARAA